MGYKPHRTLYELTFEDPDFAGLEVVTKRISVDGLMGFISMFEEFQETDRAKLTEAEVVGKLTGIFARFVKVLVRWNVEDDDDQPVPPTVEGLQSLDIDFVMAVIESWITGMVQAPPPLPGTSPSGGTSPEALLATASKSRSPES